MRRDLLLLLTLVIIAWLIVGTYQDMREMVQQLRAGQIDRAEALERVIDAVVNLPHNTLPDWSPVYRQVQRSIGQAREEVGEIVESWTGKVIALIR